MTLANTKISFIIPAFNESNYIATTLGAIEQFAPPYDYEVIVVDNGSEDDTADIVVSNKGKLVSLPEGTIAAVRNEGVKHASGNVFVFIDADVLLTEQWQSNISSVVESLLKSPDTITGSRCETPDQSNWLNRYWFSQLAGTNAAYINSGHLITTASLFKKVGGFTESLSTAEDHDFCMKAKAIGAEIKPEQSIRVVHEGYPENISAFIQRERWHGREDFESISSFVGSKVALVALLHAIVLFCSLISAFYNIAGALSMYVFIMATISIGLTLLKFNFQSAYSLLNRSLVFYFYVVGRTLAMFDRFLGHRVNKFR